MIIYLKVVAPVKVYYRRRWPTGIIIVCFCCVYGTTKTLSFSPWMGLSLAGTKEFGEAKFNQP